ncbi:MAG: hypothetical protein AMJ79_15280 [Phycisphaerae bacterium SM23_30]|nr:MAG: hypothetical protein AMJ79_15280 [Phycisphaerae bacterium SM23_30]
MPHPDLNRTPDKIKKSKKIPPVFKSPPAGLFLLALIASLLVGRMITPHWSLEKITLDVRTDPQNRLFYIYKGQPRYLENLVPFEDSLLHPRLMELYQRQSTDPPLTEQYAYESTRTPDPQTYLYYHLIARRHWRYWSLLPALVAVALCWLTREPVTALVGGIICGALLMCQYDITDAVIVRRLADTDAAGVLLLYLWLLGGLMGLWSRTGAARAFAHLMTKHFVRGPRTARLAAWFLGVVFFQGGSISAVLTGTTVKPFADAEKISHEELSYIVDATASPVASQLAFNAWPGYVQALIFVAGVPFLATETQRIAFYFKSVPFCLYANLALLLTFLMCLDKSPFMGSRLRQARARARNTGQLDAPDAEPLSARELQTDAVPENYKPHVIDFFGPLILLIAIAVGTFIATGSPQVRWAFAAAVALAMVQALLRGMSLRQVMDGFLNGLKGVVLASLILLLAMVLGSISQQTGCDIYLVDLLGQRLPFYLLPPILLALTLTISFSTGTSWGSYAVVFPLAMPLAWALAQTHHLTHPYFFMILCFAAVKDGGVFGDQCSPISDTTVLSAMCTGCDLMDHTISQIHQAALAAAAAALAWTALAFLAA